MIQLTAVIFILLSATFIAGYCVGKMVQNGIGKTLNEQRMTRKHESEEDIIIRM